MVGAHGRDHRGLVDGVGGQPSAERPRPSVDVVGEDEHLFELVDDKHRGAVTRRQRLAIAASASGPGTNTTAEWPARAQCRDQTGADERRLAATRRTGDDQQRAGPQTLDARHDLVGPAEERFGVVDVVGSQALVRAVLGDRRGFRRGEQGLVLVEDRSPRARPARSPARCRAPRRASGAPGSTPATRRPGGRSDTGRGPTSPSGARAAAPRRPGPRRSAPRRDALRGNRASRRRSSVVRRSSSRRAASICPGDQLRAPRTAGRARGREPD